MADTQWFWKGKVAGILQLRLGLSVQIERAAVARPLRRRRRHAHRRGQLRRRQARRHHRRRDILLPARPPPRRRPLRNRSCPPRPRRSSATRCSRSCPARAAAEHALPDLSRRRRRPSASRSSPISSSSGTSTSAPPASTCPDIVRARTGADPQSGDRRGASHPHRAAQRLDVLPVRGRVGHGQGTGAIKFDYANRHSSLAPFAINNKGMAYSYEEAKKKLGTRV